MRRAIVASALLLALTGAVKAVNMSDLYDQGTLAVWGAKYRISTQKILDKVILPVLLAEEQRAIGDVHIDFPTHPPPESKLAETPFAMYSHLDKEGRPEIVFPIVSLKFLDDLCTAYAWLQIHGYSLETISDYTAMLKYQSFSPGAVPKPLPTLGIPPDALKEKKVDELALGHFVTARTFILAHELGHLRYHHRGSSIPNERQADAFAAKVMERTPLPMLGALVFFMADAHLADYPPRQDATHPMSAERLHALAALISDREIAAGVESIAESLDDPDAASAIAAVGRAASPATLGPRRPHALAALATSETAQSGEAFGGTFVGVFTQNIDPGNPGPISAALSRHGARVDGHYTFGLGTGKITSGTVDGDVLYFNWEWAGNYGRGVLHATRDGNGFTGTWGYRESMNNAGTWTGQRVRAP
jgi:hypothetical protein